MENKDVSIQVAVLAEQMNGLREQQKSHAETTTREISSLKADIKLLLEALNKGKGAYTTSLIVAGSLASALTWLLTHISQLFVNK